MGAVDAARDSKNFYGWNIPHYLPESFVRSRETILFSGIQRSYPSKEDGTSGVSVIKVKTMHNHQTEEATNESLNNGKGLNTPWAKEHVLLLET